LLIVAVTVPPYGQTVGLLSETSGDGAEG